MKFIFKKMFEYEKSVLKFLPLKNRANKLKVDLHENYSLLVDVVQVVDQSDQS